MESNWETAVATATTIYKC